MNQENAFVVFQGNKIRRAWNNNEWWFAVEDVVVILTDSKDAKQYIQKMNKEMKSLPKGGYKLYIYLLFRLQAALRT